MIKLDERFASAANALRIDIRAPLAVARKDLATNRRRDAAQFRRAHRLLRPRRLREALLLQLLEQCIHGAVEEHLEIAARIAVPHQVARPLDLLARLAAHGELHRVTRLRELLDPRPSLAPWRRREETSRVGMHRSAGSLRLRRCLLRQLTDRGADVRLRCQTCDDVLHLVQRFLRRCTHQRVDIRFRQDILERPQRLEMDVSLLDARKDRRESTNEPSGREPPMNRAARQSKATLDKHPHRRVCHFDIQPTTLDLSEVGEHLRERMIPSGPSHIEGGKKRGVRESGELHANFLSPRFSSLWVPRSRAFERALTSRALRAAQRAHATCSSRQREHFYNCARTKRDAAKSLSIANDLARVFLHHFRSGSTRRVRPQGTRFSRSSQPRPSATALQPMTVRQRGSGQEAPPGPNAQAGTTLPSHRADAQAPRGRLHIGYAKRRGHDSALAQSHGIVNR